NGLCAGCTPRACAAFIPPFDRRYSRRNNGAAGGIHTPEQAASGGTDRIRLDAPFVARLDAWVRVSRTRASPRTFAARRSRDVGLNRKPSIGGATHEIR